jgi:hypothetical protein
MGVSFVEISQEKETSTFHLEHNIGSCGFVYVIHHASPFSETSSTLATSPGSRHYSVCLGIVAIGSFRIFFGFWRDPFSR